MRGGPTDPIPKSGLKGCKKNRRKLKHHAYNTLVIAEYVRRGLRGLQKLDIVEGRSYLRREVRSLREWSEHCINHLRRMQQRIKAECLKD